MSKTTKKIKVVVVDDEQLEINLIKNCINWDFLDMEIVGEAQDAISALELVEEISPDIIFTDINMPITDGIKFSEMVIKRYPKTKIVILSGYDNFNYVQKSMHIGASDYLLKPINNDELFKAASKLKNIIDFERESSKEYNLLKKELTDNLPYIKEKFLNELIYDNLDTEKIINKALFLGLRFKYQYIQVAAIEITSLRENNYNGLNFKRNTIVMNIVKQFFQMDEYTYIFYDMQNRIIILNNNENTDLLEKCEALKVSIVNNTEFCVSIGIGRQMKHMWEIQASYKEALDALKYRVTEGNNLVIFYDHINIGNINQNVCNINELNEKLSFYLRSALYDKASSVIEQYFENIDLDHRNNLKELRIMAMNIVTTSFKTLISMGLYNSDELYNVQIRLFNELILLDTLPDIIKALNEVIIEVIKRDNNSKPSKMDDMIIKAKEYIDANLSDCELSLSFTAKHLYINPSYLSRMFKKEIGISFVEYITKIRMEKAIELLRKGELKVFEIADCIGISDSNYFSTCFKKYFGVSVSEYKKYINNNLKENEYCNIKSANLN